MNDQAKRDMEDRQNPTHRRVMVALVAAVGDLIQEFAFNELSLDAPNPTPFEVDKLSEILAWQLIEFVTQTIIDRNVEVPDDFYAGCVRAYQLDLAHAASWFVADASDNNGIITVEPKDYDWGSQNQSAASINKSE